jgi:hypothetical protein
MIAILKQISKATPIEEVSMNTAILKGLYAIPMSFKDATKQLKFKKLWQ